MDTQSLSTTPRLRLYTWVCRAGSEISFILPVLLLLPFDLIAGDGGSNRKIPLPTADPQVIYAKQALQGFNLRYWLSNQMALGQQAMDVNIPPPGIGMEYPAESGIEHLYGGGPWIGAIVDGAHRVSEGYNGDNGEKYFRPDPRHPHRELIWQTSMADRFESLPSRRGYDDDLDGAIDEDDLDGRDNDGDWALSSDDVGADGIPDSLETGCKGGYDAATNPDPAFDNYQRTLTDFCHPDAYGNYRRKDDPDVYTEKNGLPDHGEPNVDEDYGAMSDNDLYCSASDANDAPAGHFPIGAHVVQKSYAWHTGSSADAVSILEYTFRNDGTHTWESPFLAFFADADVFQVNFGEYTQNSTCFIESVRTAYVRNPVDPGITPFGLAVLGASTGLDSLRLIYEWFDFYNHPSPGTADDILYGLMSGGFFPIDTTDQCSSDSMPTDVRFLVSVGPFESIAPGEEVRISYALVSGETVDAMAKNAARAKRIYEADGFIPPVARIESIGGGAAGIGWDEVRSPFGDVAFFRLYYGTTSGAYSDSVDVVGYTTDLSGLHDSVMHYFAVAAFDETGRRSAISDEISFAPDAPRGLVVTGEQRRIDLRWNASGSPDIAGYNVYRMTSSADSLVQLTTAPDTLFTDTAVEGFGSYDYAVTAVNALGFESPLSTGRSGRLIPPLVPQMFVTGPGTDFVRLEWEQNVEDDFAGYEVFRNNGGETVMLNPGRLWTPGLTDSTVVPGLSYDYYIEAVDSTGARSRTQVLHGGTVVRNRGILVYLDLCPPVTYEAALNFTEGLFAGYQHTILSRIPSSSPPGVHELTPYSSVVWFSECANPFPYYGRQYPLSLKGYVAGGGNLLIVGAGMTTKAYPDYYRFLSDLFGVTPFLEVDTTADFAGATGVVGYPSVVVDDEKLAFRGGRANLVERFAGIPAERVLYSYVSDPVDSSREGKPVGIRAQAADRMAYYFSFPLYYLDSSDASSLIHRVMGDFGEVLLGVADGGEELPTTLHLYDAYPNPFNPSTTIRFDVPERGRVRLLLYDLLGRELSPLLDQELPAGRHELRWDASRMASGLYYVRLLADGAAHRGGAGPELRKLLLVK